MEAKNPIPIMVVSMLVSADKFVLCHPKRLLWWSSVYWRSTLKTMNIHPLFVHFPIAFLSLYSILEIVSVGKLRRSQQLVFLKAFLAVIGVLGAMVAAQTGEMAEKVFGGAASRPLIEMHSFFANIATYLYALIAICYIIKVVNSEQLASALPGWAVRPWGWLSALQRMVLSPWIAKPLALVAFVVMIIVGALGAALVYGPEIDPAVNTIYHWFFTEP